MAASSTTNGVASAQRVITLILGVVAILGIVAGSIYAWSDVTHEVARHSERLNCVEATAKEQDETLQAIERKLDRLLILQGADPDEFRAQ